MGARIGVGRADLGHKFVQVVGHAIGQQPRGCIQASAVVVVRPLNIFVYACIIQLTNAEKLIVRTSIFIQDSGPARRWVLFYQDGVRRRRDTILVARKIGKNKQLLMRTLSLRTSYSHLNFAHATQNSTQSHN